jgi:hypothetical protein
LTLRGAERIASAAGSLSGEFLLKGATVKKVFLVFLPSWPSLENIFAD